AAQQAAARLVGQRMVDAAIHAAQQQPSGEEKEDDLPQHLRETHQPLRRQAAVESLRTRLQQRPSTSCTGRTYACGFARAPPTPSGALAGAGRSRHKKRAGRESRVKKPRIIDGVFVFGEPDADTLAQIKRCAAPKEAAGAVLCADAHKGYSMPIGGVVAYDGLTSPSGVGFDIGCGNKAVRTNLKVDDIRADLPALMDEI